MKTSPIDATHEKVIFFSTSTDTSLNILIEPDSAEIDPLVSYPDNILLVSTIPGYTCFTTSGTTIKILQMLGLTSSGVPPQFNLTGINPRTFHPNAKDLIRYKNADGLCAGVQFYICIEASPIPPNPIPCFSEDTKILCLTKEEKEEYRLIQDLVKGDLVKVYLHGYIPISVIKCGIMYNYPNNINCCMYKMRKTADNNLIEDLIITGLHGILVDKRSEKEETNPKWADFKIEDKFNVISAVSEKFEKVLDNNMYKYYNFALQKDNENIRYGVWANGILVETPTTQLINSKKF
jgi:hypothetical protein